MADLEITNVIPPSGSTIDPDTTPIVVTASEEIEAGDESIDIIPNTLEIVNVAPPSGSTIDPDVTPIIITTNEEIEAGDESIDITPESSSGSSGDSGGSGSSSSTATTIRFDIKSSNITITGNTLTIDLTGTPLAPYTKYRLKFDDGAILSETGEVLSYSSFPEFTFTTGAK